MFKMVMAAVKSRHLIRGENQLPKVIAGATCSSSIEVINNEQIAARPRSQPDSCLL